jgi:hypothetical protein
MVMTRRGTDSAQNMSIKTGLIVPETYPTSTYTDNFNGKMAYFFVDVPRGAKVLTHFFYQASLELAPTYAALILADDGIEITVSLANDLLIKILTYIALGGQDFSANNCSWRRNGTDLGRFIGEGSRGQGNQGTVVLH